MGASIMPQRPRYRPLQKTPGVLGDSTQAQPRPLTPPAPLTEPPNPTGMVKPVAAPAKPVVPAVAPPAYFSGGAPGAVEPSQATPQTPIATAPQAKSPPVGPGGDPVATGLPGGGKSPAQAGGAVPAAKPMAPAPPALPPAPIVEPPNPAGAIDPGVQEFDANLRSSVFTPGDDPRLKAAQGDLDAASRNVQSGAGYGELQQGAESRYRKLLAPNAVASGDMGALPNRTELAKQAFADFDKQGEAGLQQRFRAVGQKAAALGRIGAGMTTNDLTDVFSQHERDRLLKQNELARGVAEGDISDRFRKVEFDTGLNERNADRGYNAQRDAIDYGGRDADRAIGDRYNRLDAASSLEGRLFDQGARNRDEFRAERGRQDTQSQMSLENRIREREMQERTKSTELARALALMQAGGRTPTLDSLLGG
jgi:hypothetical protein